LERKAEIILGSGPIERPALANIFVQYLAIKLDALGQWFVLSGLLAVELERIGQAELHAGQGFRVPDAFPAPNQRTDLRDQGREPIRNVMSGLVEGEFDQAGLVSKPKICFRSLQNNSGSAMVSVCGRYFPVDLAPETSRAGVQ